MTARLLTLLANVFLYIAKVLDSIVNLLIVILGWSLRVIFTPLVFITTSDNLIARIIRLIPLLSVISVVVVLMIAMSMTNIQGFVISIIGSILIFYKIKNTDDEGFNELMILLVDLKSWLKSSFNELIIFLKKPRTLDLKSVSWFLLILIASPFLAIIFIITKSKSIWLFFTNYGYCLFQIIGVFFLGLYVTVLVIDAFIETKSGIWITLCVYLCIAFYKAKSLWCERSEDIAAAKADIEYNTPIILEDLRNGQSAAERFKTADYYDRWLISKIIYNEWCRLHYIMRDDVKNVDDSEWFDVLQKELDAINKTIEECNNLRNL
jgi:hypothetical protein